MPGGSGFFEDLHELGTLAQPLLGLQRRKAFVQEPIVVASLGWKFSFGMHRELGKKYGLARDGGVPSPERPASAPLVI